MISTCHPCNALCATEDQDKRYENHPFEVPVKGGLLFLLSLISMDDAKEFDILVLKVLCVCKSFWLVVVLKL